MNRQYFETLCKMSQKTLKKHLFKMLKKDGECIKADGFLFRRGTLPICLVAHLDTVHEHLPNRFIYANGKLSSPQGIGGDDRAGVYIIMELLKRFDVSVVFCEDEEIGGIGAEKFAKTDFCKTLGADFIIELDRKGNNDAVFYDCDNDAFIDYIISTGYFTEQSGTFSDICVIAPAMGCSAVNLSAGYYNAHMMSEYVVLSDVDKIIKEVSKLIRNHDGTFYKWIERPYKSIASYIGYKSYAWTDDDDYDDTYEERGNKLYIVTCGDIYEEYYAHNIFEAGGRFLATYPSATWNDLEIDYYGTDYDYI